MLVQQYDGTYIRSVLLWLSPSGGVGTVWVLCGTWYGMVWHGVRCATVCDIVCWYGMTVRFGMLYRKITVCDRVCWWYGTMVRCGGYIVWLNIVWLYGMFQHIRSVGVKHVVSTPFTTT